MEEPAPAGGSRTPTPTQGPGISGINDRESRPVDQGSDIDWSRSIPEIDQQLHAKYGLDEDAAARPLNHGKLSAAINCRCPPRRRGGHTARVLDHG